MSRATGKGLVERVLQLAAEYRQLIEAEVSGFAVDAAACRARRNQCDQDFAAFAATYFPHYIRHPSRSMLHEHLFERLPAIVAAEKSCCDAIAAPRGESKSTLVSQLFVLWCIVTGKKKYPIIIMDALDQALPMLEAIKAELAFNPRLSMDYPHACGAGRVWQVGTIITQNDAKVQAFGSGKKLRGLRHGPHRPDLCVLDDIENDENVRSPEQRDKLQSWLTKAVLPLGGAGEKYDVVYIGTILHYDSVLSRTLNNPMWHTARFKAVLRWPNDMTLWDRWEELLRNDGEDVADAYYAARQAEMTDGAIVSWVARPLLSLMKIRARDGHAAFDSEYQNAPVAGDNAPFAGVIEGNFWTALPPGLIYFGACDPSLGKHGASRDPSALLVGGFDRKTGVLYVVAAEIKKRLPDRIIEDVISLHAKWRCALWAVETVQFQEFLRTELIKRSAARGIPVPARAVQPSTDKVLRIETLQPHMANGLIKLHPAQVTLIDQLRHFPKADHDDGPDALHMLWMAAVSGSGVIEFHRVKTGLGARFQKGAY